MREGLTLERLGISDWQKIAIERDCLLLYKDTFPPEDNCPGFSFYCVDFMSQECRENAPIEYDILFEGAVYFDGVRHIYFGSEKTDNYGYLYYLDVPLLIKALQALDNLQETKCPYVAEEREKSAQSKGGKP